MSSKAPLFKFNHVMLRVKDADASLDFYQRVLGMQLVREEHHEEGAFSLYFLSFVDDSGNPYGAQIELTHNHGTEKEVDFSYHNGNVEPRGYGHVCLSVPNLDETIAWLDSQQVVFAKRPEEGTMRDIAFIVDPDGYRIEVLAHDRNVVVR